MRWIWEYLHGATCPCSEERQPDLKQALDVTDMFLVDNEQDHVIIGFDHCAVMGDQHLLLAHHSAYGGARRQLYLADGPAYHPGGTGVAMGDDFDRFGGAPAQGVDVDDVAPAYVGQQGAYGCQRRRDGDLDLPAWTRST